MRTSDAAMRTSPSHVYYPWQVFFDGDFNRRRAGGLYINAVQPKMPGASNLSKTGRYSVTSTLARRQQFFVAAQPTGTFSERNTDGCCYYHFKTSFKPYGDVSAEGGSADPARTSTEKAAPTTRRIWSITRKGD